MSHKSVHNYIHGQRSLKYCLNKSMANGHRDTGATVNSSATTELKINCNFYLPHNCHMCPNKKYAHQMPHICKIYKLVHVHIQLHQYVYITWPHCNQQYDHEHLYTYISYYHHQLLNKYAQHILHTCTTELLL